MEMFGSKVRAPPLDLLSDCAFVVSRWYIDSLAVCESVI